VYRFPENQGAAAAHNFAIQQARGEFIALINSDDMWEPTKLQRQLEVLDARPELGAVFTGVRFIDEKGKPVPAERLPRSNVFRQPNRSQAQWLRYLFENGNVLCHPSSLVRREFYEQHGLYDNRLRQLPDFAKWVTLVKHYPIAVLGDEDLVRFRILPSEANASSVSPANVARGLREHLAIAEHLFDGCSNEMLVEGFADLLRNPHIAQDDERQCELAFLWWDTPCGMQEINRIHALRLMHDLMGRPDTARLLETRYGFDDLTLHTYAGIHQGGLSPAFQEWINTFHGGADPAHPDLIPIAEAPSGHLFRVLVARTRKAKPSTLPNRALYHLRRGMSRR
jgi:hypothetical protein